MTKSVVIAVLVISYSYWPARLKSAAWHLVTAMLNGDGVLDVDWTDFGSEPYE